MLTDYVNTGYVCACNTMKQGLFDKKKIKYFWLAARVEFKLARIEFKLARIEFNLMELSKVITATSTIEINSDPFSRTTIWDTIVDRIMPTQVTFVHVTR